MSAVTNTMDIDTPVKQEKTTLALPPIGGSHNSGDRNQTNAQAKRIRRRRNRNLNKKMRKQMKREKREQRILESIAAGNHGNISPCDNQPDPRSVRATAPSHSIADALVAYNIRSARQILTEGVCSDMPRNQAWRQSVPLPFQGQQSCSRGNYGHGKRRVKFMKFLELHMNVQGDHLGALAAGGSGNDNGGNTPDLDEKFIDLIGGWTLGSEEDEEGDEKDSVAANAKTGRHENLGKGKDPEVKASGELVQLFRGMELGDSGEDLNE